MSFLYKKGLAQGNIITIGVILTLKLLDLLFFCLFNQFTIILSLYVAAKANQIARNIQSINNLTNYQQMFQKSSNKDIKQMNAGENYRVDLQKYAGKLSINRSRSNKLLHSSQFMNDKKGNDLCEIYHTTEEASFSCKKSPNQVYNSIWDDQYLHEQLITNQQKKYSRESICRIFSCENHSQQLKIAQNDTLRQSSTSSESNRTQKFKQNFIAVQNGRMGLATQAYKNSEENIIMTFMNEKLRQKTKLQTLDQLNKSPQKILGHKRQSLGKSDNRYSHLDENEFVMSDSLSKNSESTVYSARNQSANLEYIFLTQSDQDQIASQQSDETLRICYEPSQEKNLKYTSQSMLKEPLKLLKSSKNEESKDEKDPNISFLNFFNVLCSNEDTKNFIEFCSGEQKINLEQFMKQYWKLIDTVLTQKKLYSNFDHLGSNSEAVKKFPEHISSMKNDKFVLYFNICLLRAFLDKKSQIPVQLITKISNFIQENHKAFMNSYNYNQVVFDSIHIDLVKYYINQTHYLEASRCIIRYKLYCKIDIIEQLIRKLESQQVIQHSDQHQQYSQISRLLTNQIKLSQDDPSTQDIAASGTKIYSQRSPDSSVRNRMQKQMINQTSFMNQTRRLSNRTSVFHKKDFKMGSVLQNKGDRETVQMAFTYVSQANQTIKNTNNINPVNSNSMIQGYRGKQELFTKIYVTIREIDIGRYNTMQENQLNTAILFLNKHRHENLLDCWGCFYDSGKMFCIHEPVVQHPQLFLPFQYSEKDQMIHQKVSAIDFPKEQLYNFVSQMINLYKYLLKNYGLKALHIKPGNILLLQNGQLKVYHLVLPSSEPSKNTEQKIGDMTQSRVGQLATEDLSDLGQFIYYLCTQKSLLPEVKQQILMWCDQYRNQKATHQQSSTQSISKQNRSIDKFILLPNEIQKLILLFLKIKPNVYHNWENVQRKVDELIGPQKNYV